MTDITPPKDPSRLSLALQSDFVYQFKRSPVAVVSFAITLILVLGAVFAPLIAPYNPFDPASLNLMNGFSRPMTPNAFTGDSFWLGTDDQGRDVFSTILYGMRISLFVGAAAVAFAMVLGITLGLLAGYVGGWTDAIITRVSDGADMPVILGQTGGFGPPPALRIEPDGWTAEVGETYRVTIRNLREGDISYDVLVVDC